MKTKIPKKVNILGHEYTVEFVDPKVINYRGGECEYPSRIIRLSNELQGSGEFAWIYFLHEAWHGVQFERGDVQFLEPQTLEIFADTFASIVTSLQKQKIL